MMVAVTTELQNILFVYLAKEIMVLDMKKVLRALVISAVATVAAGAAIAWVDRDRDPERKTPRGNVPRGNEFDVLDDEHKEAMLNELAAQV